MYRLVETHAHLDEIKDLERVLKEAEAAGIRTIIAVGQDYESNQKTLAIGERYKGLVYPALGLHPANLEVATLERDLRFIADNASRAVAIGEIGLDYHKRVRQKADKALQAQVFRQVLKIAGTNNLPALVHSRYAWRDALDLVKEAGLEKAVFHWYTGTSSVLGEIINLGYFVSATPAVEYHEEHRKAIKAAPPDRLLLETDSPVVYGRGSDTELEARPVDILRSLKGVSELTGRDEAGIAEVTSNNALKLFGLS